MFRKIDGLNLRTKGFPPNHYLPNTYMMSFEVHINMIFSPQQLIANHPSLNKFLQSLAYDKKKFDAADEDKDGKLSTDEAVAFLHPYDFERMSDVETDRVMSEFDKNNDGKIDLDEYIGHSTFAKSKIYRDLGLSTILISIL